MNEGISIIIPVVDEAEIIEKTIFQFSKPAAGNIEILVVDGGSNDNTCDLAEKAGARIIRCQTRSRAAQMNMAAKAAKYSVLYFVHADVRVPKSFQSDILECLVSGYSCGCYRSDFETYPGLMRINAFLTRFNILSFRGGDQSLFITKEVFSRLNGFNEWYTIMEDYDIIKRIWDATIPFKLIQKNVVISTRKYENNSWLRVQIANGVAMYLFKKGAHPEKIRQAYKKLLSYKPDNY
jgi:rSAM/selenodomain-associated transferase 2